MREMSSSKGARLMGYSTVFEGAIYLNHALDESLYAFLKKLNETRRMKRDPQVLKQMGYSGDYGVEGEFFVEGGGLYGQAHDESILNFNEPPCTQPSLWCQWIPTEDRTAIVWDEGEKFYGAAEWMYYLIETILKPKGYVASGEIFAQGEDPNDRWILSVEENEVCIIYL